METKNCSFDFEINVNRMDEFTAIYFEVPKELKDWLMFQEGNPIEFMLPNKYFDYKVKKHGSDYKWLTSRTREMRNKFHHVYTQEYIDSYKKGDTLLFRTDIEPAEKDQFLSADTAQDRIYRYCDDGWLRCNGEVLERDILIEAWPTYYGNPKTMKAKMEEHPCCIDVEIKPNECWQNHDISGRSLVYVKVRLAKEQLDEYFKQNCTTNSFWVLEEVLGLERIEEEESY